eukprot:scaffold3127_cov202-Prasinococcus_capsulatus_cf.AAC.18
MPRFWPKIDPISQFLRKPAGDFQIMRTLSDLPGQAAGAYTLLAYGSYLECSTYLKKHLWRRMAD